MSTNTLKQIAISEENYQSLKKLGDAGDRFNDVLTKLLKEKKILKPDCDLTNLNQVSKKSIDLGGDHHE